jgi:hypothetical protein
MLHACVQIFDVMGPVQKFLSVFAHLNNQALVRVHIQYDLCLTLC